VLTPGFNTDLVPKGTEPKTFADLLDPKWRGKMIVDDPRAPGPGNVLWAVLLDVMGRPYLEKLAAQNLTLTGDAPLAARRVAQGEFSALIGLNMTLLYNLQGLPAQGVIPAEGASLVENVASLLKNAPHPNAGRLLLNYLLEEDTQKFIASQGLWSSTGMKSDEVPAILKNIQTVKWAGAVTPEQVDPSIAIFKEILK